MLWKSLPEGWCRCDSVPLHTLYAHEDGAWSVVVDELRERVAGVHFMRAIRPADRRASSLHEAQQMAEQAARELAVACKACGGSGNTITTLKAVHGGALPYGEYVPHMKAYVGVCPKCHGTGKEPTCPTTQGAPASLAPTAGLVDTLTSSAATPSGATSETASASATKVDPSVTSSALPSLARLREAVEACPDYGEGSAGREWNDLFDASRAVLDAGIEKDLDDARESAGGWRECLDMVREDLEHFDPSTKADCVIPYCTNDWLRSVVSADRAKIADLTAALAAERAACDGLRAPMRGGMLPSAVCPVCCATTDATRYPQLGANIAEARAAARTHDCRRAAETRAP